MNEQQQHELQTIIGKYAPNDGGHATAIPWVRCSRISSPKALTPVVYTPSACFVVQGAKHVLLADELYRYGAANYLVVSVDLPLMPHVTRATAEAPYLCMQIEIDVHAISALVTQQGNRLCGDTGAQRGLFIGTADVVMADALVRLARLLETPNGIPFLASLLQQELYYHLLNTQHGATIAQITIAGSNMARIAHVIAYLKQHVHQVVHIDELADMARMSTSSLHHVFKDVTAMSPLQYHKRLRLLEARRLMLSEDADAATAGLRVGYESASQFSREYRRLFGAPPRQDMVRLRTRVNA